MKVPYIDLKIQHESLSEQLTQAVTRIVLSGNFILGEDLQDLEKEVATRCNTKYALGVANGTDALILALKALNIQKQDEIITAPNSFLASASSIHLAGATPVFADVSEDMNIDPEAIRKVVTKNTKAIMPVHLTGKPAAMDEIKEIAKEFELYIIEDAAQAFGASYKGSKIGSIGDFGCFSMHPLKNLSACGDAGFITLNDEESYNYLIQARNHGLKNRDECAFFSLNSRLDNLQAAILNVKIKHIDEWNSRRREIANKYNNAFRSFVQVPEILENEYAVFHTYIIQSENRNELQNYLKEKGVDSKIHYPIPIHQQEGFRNLYPENMDFKNTNKQCQEILSLPIFPELTDDQVELVIESVTSFFKN